MGEMAAITHKHACVTFLLFPFFFSSSGAESKPFDPLCDVSATDADGLFAVDVGLKVAEVR
jgi:hypothetical protein